MHDWIKLHTALKDHEIMRDGTALQVFVYMLISADDDGYGIVSRYKSAQFLGLNSNTFYSALKRCEKKHNLATLTSTRYWTNFSILNWHKYQTIGNTSSNTSSTPEQHLSNTNINKERIRKRIESKPKEPTKPLTAKTGLVACTQAEIKAIAEKNHVSYQAVKSLHEEIMDKIQDGIFQKKAYGTSVYYTLSSWVRRGIRRGEIEVEEEVEILYE